MFDAESCGVSLMLRKWSVSVSPADEVRLLEFIRLLLEWNVRVNVTGARNASEVVGEHFPDSLALFRLVPPGVRLIDIGSGGGLPVVPFSILRPDCLVTMVEPRAKRVAFLKTVVRVLQCSNLKVFRQRMEECERHLFEVACSRATFSPFDWLTSAPALLAPGGRTIVLSTGEVSPCPSGFSLLDSLDYQTSNGSVRWAGSYCST